MRILFLVLLLLLPMPGWGRMVWDLDGIAKQAYQRVNLYDKTRNVVSTITVEQAREITGIRDRIAAIAGIKPNVLLMEGNDINGVTGKKFGDNTLAITIGSIKAFSFDPDALAFLIGHEMAHLARNHVGTSQSRDLVLDILGTVLGAVVEAKSGVPVGGVVGSAASAVASLKFDRDQEREADSFALEWMRKAGFDVGGSIRLMEKLSSSKATDFFSSHPLTAERMENLRRQIADPTYRPVAITRPTTQEVGSFTP